jgi:hypothetical protein
MLNNAREFAQGTAMASHRANYERLKPEDLLLEEGEQGRSKRCLPPVWISIIILSMITLISTAQALYLSLWSESRCKCPVVEEGYVTEWGQ